MATIKSHNAASLVAAATFAVLATAGCQSTSGDLHTQTVTVPAAQSEAATTAPANTTQASTPPADTAITPEMLGALHDLSAPDYPTRQKAVATLQRATAQHYQQMLLVQEMLLKIQDDLAQQMKAITGSVDVPDQAKVAGLMEFNQAISHWAMDALKLPKDQREAMLQWGLSPAGYPLVVRAYSLKDEVRGNAAADVAKVNNDSAVWLLGHLLDDNDREVSLRAMNAVYDKTPTAKMIDILWDKACAQMMQQIRPQQVRQRTVNVHGRLVTVGDQDYNTRMQDGDVATDVLIHWNNPLIKDRLNALFIEMMGTIKEQNDYRWRLISPNYGEGGKLMTRLIEAYRPREGFVFLAKALAGNTQDGYVNQNNAAFYWQSARVDVASLLIELTGQDPATYGLKKVPNNNDRWALQTKNADQPAALKQEQEMVAKLTAWWKEHGKEYTGPDKNSASTTTAPAKPS